MTEIITNDIASNFFLLRDSFKKIIPKNTLRIGKIKQPKLASTSLLLTTAYIQVNQLVTINMLQKNKIKVFFMFFKIRKTSFHFEYIDIVKRSRKAVQTVL